MKRGESRAKGREGGREEDRGGRGGWEGKKGVKRCKRAKQGNMEGRASREEKSFL